MDRLGAGLLGGLDDLLDVQIALGRDRGADQERLVGLAHVGRVAVDLRVDGDRADPHLLQGAGDADRDLAAVGYQDLLEHGGAVYLGRRTGGRRAPPQTRSPALALSVLVRGFDDPPITERGARLRRRVDRAAESFDGLRRAAGAGRGRRGGRGGRRDDAGADRPRRGRGGPRGRRGGASGWGSSWCRRSRCPACTSTPKTCISAATGSTWRRSAPACERAQQERRAPGRGDRREPARARAST